jgi:hypothetical protein
MHQSAIYFLLCSRAIFAPCVPIYRYVVPERFHSANYASRCKKKRLERAKPFRPKVRFMATYQKAGASYHVNTAASAGCAGAPAWQTAKPGSYGHELPVISRVIGCPARIEGHSAANSVGLATLYALYRVSRVNRHPTRSCPLSPGCPGWGGARRRRRL